MLFRSFSYTVVADSQIDQSGSDGYIGPMGLSMATFRSASAQFIAANVGQYLDFNTALAVNEGRWAITAVLSSTSVMITRPSGTFLPETGVKWQLLATVGTSQRILMTKDLALAAGQGLRVTYIDEKDADFYDSNWSTALATLETQDLQILVPLPSQTMSAIQQACRVHVERMSSTYFKRERVLFTGALSGLTVDNVTGVSLAAVEDLGVLEGIQGDSPEDILDGNIEDLANYDVSVNFGDSFRVVFFWPDQIIKVVNGSSETLPGYYAAAAAGGRVAGTANIAEPLTFKTLVGFSLANSKT